MTDRATTRAGQVEAPPEARGGGDATPSLSLPDGAPLGIPGRPMPMPIGSAVFDWGTRTFVMGILNLTPDSFSGDGLLATADPTSSALEQARRMLLEGADVIDVGGESTRPGHAAVDASTEIERVVPVIASLRAAHPHTPISVDTTKPAVAAAALDAGADLVNDVWGIASDDALVRLAAERGVPIVLMHNRAEARYTNLMSEILSDLQAAIERALRVGVAWEAIIVDPGFGFGKTPEHNLALLHDLPLLRALGRPILLGTSRKSTLGKVLDLPATERLEATIATTALAVEAGVDIVRVHDVRPNVRAARMADAVVRAGPRIAAAPPPSSRAMPLVLADPPVAATTGDRIALHNIRLEGRHGWYDHELENPQPFEIDVELSLDLRPAGITDDLANTVDYGRVYAIVRRNVESTSHRLLEALAEAISRDILAGFPVAEVGVRIRKPAVQLGGPLDDAAVEIRRRRDG